MAEPSWKMEDDEALPALLLVVCACCLLVPAPVRPWLLRFSGLLLRMVLDAGPTDWCPSGV